MQELRRKAEVEIRAGNFTRWIKAKDPEEELLIKLALRNELPQFPLSITSPVLPQSATFTRFLRYICTNL